MSEPLHNSLWKSKIGVGILAAVLGTAGVTYVVSHSMRSASPLRAQPLNAIAPLTDIVRSHQVAENPGKVRKTTEYIIIHTTEGGFSGALETLRNNHSAQYLVRKDGTIYSIVPERERAEHAGPSVWNGQEYLNSRSLGIEFEGTYAKELTPEQYASGAWLIGELKTRYQVDDDHVLKHSQVRVYEQRVKLKNGTAILRQRGKKCANSVDMQKLGVHWADEDPDVAAGRIVPETAVPQKNGTLKLADGRTITLKAGSNIKYNFLASGDEPAHHEYVLGRGQTAYQLVGAKYDDANTLYITPKGHMTGEQVRNWRALPVGTRIYTDADELIARLSR